MAVKKKPQGGANKPPAGTTNEGGEGEGGEEEDDDPNDQPVTMRELNAAISKSLGRFQRKVLPEMLATTLAKTLDDAGIGKKPDDDGEGEGEGGEDAAQGAQGGANGGAEGAGGSKGQQGAQTPQKTPQNSAESRKLAKLQKELEAMRASQEQEKARAAAEEQRRVLGEMFGTAGVKKELTAPLIAYMTSEDSGRMVRRNAEGKLVFVQRDGEDEDELPLKEGLTAWLKTDTGKTYLAPRQVGGSGFQPPRQGAPPGTRPATAAQGIAQAEDELMAAVLGTVQGGNFASQ